MNFLPIRKYKKTFKYTCTVIIYRQSVSKVMNYLLSPPFHPSFFVYTFPYLLGDNRVFSCVSGQIVQVMICVREGAQDLKCGILKIGYF